MTRSLVAFLSLLLVFVAPCPSIADDRAQMVGTWKLVSFEVEFQDTGERQAPYGANPLGYTIITSAGRMMTVIEGEGRKPAQTDEERATLFRNMFAWTGPFRLDGEKFILVNDVVWNPVWRAEQNWTYKLEGDRLVLASAWAPAPNFPGKMTRGASTWSRVK